MKQKSNLALCHASDRSSLVALALALSALLSSPGHAAVRAWSGTSGVSWSTGGVGGNWTDLAAPITGDSLTFSTFVNPATNNDLAADTSFVAINFTNTGNTQNFSLSGARITLGGGINTTASSGTTNTSTDTIALAMILSGDRTITTGTRHNLTVTGIISDDGTPRSFLKAGAGSLSLQAANTLTGAAQINEGTLNISGLNGSVSNSSGVNILGGTVTIANTNAANNPSRLNDSGTLAMTGGVFNFNNNGGAVNYSETTGALLLNAGAAGINPGQAAAGQTSTLAFASLARSSGATVNFGGTGLGADTRNHLIVAANPTLANNIIGGWATIGAVDWASYDATNGIIALPPASYTADAWAAGNNTTVTTSTSPASDSETHTLRFNLAAADTVTLAGTNTITGGILVTAGVAANVSTITGGALQGPAGGELILQQHNTTAGNGLTIGSVIQNNASACSLVKTGGGTATLTATNTYTGGTVINSGSIVLNNAAGEAIQGPITLSGNGRVVLAASNQIADTTVITFSSGNNSARINLTNVPGSNFSETVAGIADAAGTFSGSRIIESASDGVAGSPGVLTINTAGLSYTFGGFVRDAAGTAPGSTLTLIKEGAGSQTFSGASVTHTGTTTVKAGSLRFTGSVINASAVSLEGGTIEFGAAGTRSNPITSTVSTGGVLKSGTGTLIFTGDNTYTGITNISNGTLQLNRAGGTIADTATVTVSSDTAILNVAQSDTIGTLNLALASTVSGAGTLTVNTAITPNIAINKINTISASLAGTAQLKKTGQGTTVLSGVNSYSGGTWLNGANSKLTISGSGTLGSTSGTLLIDTLGTVLDLGTTSQTVGAVTLTEGTIQNGTLTGSSYSIASGTVSAALAGSGVALSKTTAGTATLSGLNTYTGSTAVGDGTLFINSNNSLATGAMTVSSPGTLGGNGTLGGALTVSAGGTLAPGAASAAVGTLTATAGASVAGTYACDVDGASADKLTVTGTVTLSGPLTVNLLGGGFSQPSYIIAEGTTLSGTFSSVPTGYAVTYNATQAILSQAAGDPYAAWINGFTPNALLPDAASKLPSADPDHDDISNLLEFVLTGSPVVSSQSINPTLATVGSNQVLSYKRSDESESPATTQVGQWSTNLTTWTDVTPVVVNENGALADDMSITVPDTNAVGGKLFLRINVVK